MGVATIGDENHRAANIIRLLTHIAHSQVEGVEKRSESFSLYEVAINRVFDRVGVA
jgi:hypothetical protein